MNITDTPFGVIKKNAPWPGHKTRRRLLKTTICGWAEKLEVIRQIHGSNGGDQNACKYKDFHTVYLFLKFLPYVMARTLYEYNSG